MDGTGTSACEGIRLWKNDKNFENSREFVSQNLFSNSLKVPSVSELHFRIRRPPDKILPLFLPFISPSQELLATDSVEHSMFGPLAKIRMPLAKSHALDIFVTAIVFFRFVFVTINRQFFPVLRRKKCEENEELFSKSYALDIFVAAIVFVPFLFRTNKPPIFAVLRPERAERTRNYFTRCLRARMMTLRANVG